jgi:hypothetical protein
MRLGFVAVYKTDWYWLLRLGCRFSVIVYWNDNPPPGP